MMRITRRCLGVLWSFVAVLLLATVIPILQAQEGEAFAPADQAAFEDLVVGQRMIFNDSIFDYWEFMAGGRFKGAAGADSGTGSYSYSNTGVNTGDLAINVDDGGESFTAHLVFTSTTAGTLIVGPSPLNWRLIPIPELTTLYFPDYADGAGWSVQLAVSNINPTENAARSRSFTGSVSTSAAKRKVVWNRTSSVIGLAPRIHVPTTRFGSVGIDRDTTRGPPKQIHAVKATAPPNAFT